MKKFDKTPVFATSDIIIILFVALLALVSILFIVNNKTSHENVSVKLGGRVYAEYSLDKVGEYEIVGENDIRLTLVVEHDGVRVKNAGCPDKLCEKTGKISAAGQSIICLPGKISVSLTGGSENIDAAVG
ncbi:MULTISPECIES: NusG domain II-containing protein [unclassified Ruminococcus]|uniref:NusG domain II-containing protein n=1 Tax=unclassified Ruminococcus TaxID=2608920 RepID=UPI00210A800E|nr:MULTISPECIES: NusG domain II-containing protein [unclassified Ruminococcus]MCQ4022872.1 NusG domain II-containing protein [Ruminococcus sp. zg-924]MCQ4115312.1 NusG domain II-containing protein [Ruminococcus sp. zg-921]